MRGGIAGRERVLDLDPQRRLPLHLLRRGVGAQAPGQKRPGAAGGAWCGWIGLPWIVLIASGSGLAFAGALTLMGRRPDGMMPFGPFLALGIGVVWLGQFRLVWL